jgi:hypothetical protein
MHISIIKYGDYWHKPYTDSIWYSDGYVTRDEFNATAMRFWGGIDGGGYVAYDQVKSVISEDGIIIRATSRIEPNILADKFKDYLKKEGWKELKSVTITFTD